MTESDEMAGHGSFPASDPPAAWNWEPGTRRHRRGSHPQARRHDESVTDNRSLSRYEIEMDGEVAGFSAYRRRGDRVIFTETVIEPRFRGRGVGSRLVAAALADTERRGLRVVPECSFVQQFLRLKPDPHAAPGARRG